MVHEVQELKKMYQDQIDALHLQEELLLLGGRESSAGHVAKAELCDLSTNLSTQMTVERNQQIRRDNRSLREENATLRAQLSDARIDLRRLDALRNEFLELSGELLEAEKARQMKKIRMM